MSPAIAASLRQHGFDPEELANLGLVIAQLNGERLLGSLSDDRREEVEVFGAGMYQTGLVAGLDYAGARRARRLRGRRAFDAGTP